MNKVVGDDKWTGGDDGNLRARDEACLVARVGRTRRRDKPNSAGGGPGTA
ncbi:hypothetical protein ABIE67_000887 [Streptomyces sp. V4I8]